MIGKKTFKIGELAEATSTKVVTIRYYEKIGLMAAPPRTESNYRLYNERHKQQLHFIRRCRHLGFNLDNIRELLNLKLKQQDCMDVDRIATEHLATVQERIADLRSLEAELQRITKSCKGGHIGSCRIIEALSPTIDG